MSDLFFENLVLLSSAVADADNQVMTNGKKLEVLTAIHRILPQVDKSDIVQGQKKLEDLCIRMLFQDQPSWLVVKAITAVLTLCYARGSHAALHACVAFLFQVVLFNPKDRSSKLDRPLPDNIVVSTHMRSVCLSVAVGIVTAKGPSAAYFVPNILACVTRLTKQPDPAARELAVRALAQVITSVGVPGSKVAEEMFGQIIFKLAVGDKSPQVRIACAQALIALIEKFPPVLTNNHADSVQNACMRILVNPADQLKEQGFVGPLLVEARNTFSKLFVSVLVVSVGNTSVCGLKSVNSFQGAVTHLASMAKKYRSTAHAVEGLSSVAIRVCVALGEKEEHVVLLGKTLLSEIAVICPSVTERCIRRLVNCGQDDSGVLRLVSELIVPIISSRGEVVHAEPVVVAAMYGLHEAITIVDSSIAALSIDVGSEIITLIDRWNGSTSIATAGAFVLRALCKAAPNTSFALCNVLLNQITIQNAELMAAERSEYVITRSILHSSICLSSVLSECATSLPQDVVNGVIGVATSLIGDLKILNTDDTNDSILQQTISLLPSVHESQRRSSGFILILPLVNLAPVLTLLSIWKSVIGKRMKDNIVQSALPGTVIEDLGPYMEVFQLLLTCMRSVVGYLDMSSIGKNSIDTNIMRMISVLLHNAWQVCQSVVALEQSCVDQFPSFSLLVHAVRAQLYSAWTRLEIDQNLAKPLSMYLSDEISKPDSVFGFRTSPSLLFSSAIGKPFSCIQDELLDLTDSLMETSTTEFDYCLSIAVHADLASIGPCPTTRDFFNSCSTSAGVFEEYFAFYPASPGSPFCPIYPYLADIDALRPLTAQTLHPVPQARIAGIRLLAKLLAEVVDSSTFDACANVLAAAYKAIDQLSSVEYEDHNSSKKDQALSIKANTVVAAIAATTVLTFKPAQSVSEHGSSTLLSLAASPFGLGSLHPMTRRLAAGMVASIYAANMGLRDSIFQCVTDSAVSKTARTRSATALLISFIVDFNRGSISILTTFGPVLFKLARELSLPTRACTLFAIMSVSQCLAQSALQPWIKEITKVVTAHAVADLYPNGLSSALLAGIVSSAITAVSEEEMNEKTRFVLLWESLKDVSVIGSQTRAFGTITERMSVEFVKNFHTGRPPEHVQEYVIESIASSSMDSCSAVCGTALEALANIACEVGISVKFFNALFSVSDTNPGLRSKVDTLLKVLVDFHARHGSAGSVLQHLINGLTVSGDNASPEADEDEEEYDEYDDENQDKPDSSQGGNKSASRRSMSVLTKTLMVQCIIQILDRKFFNCPIGLVEKLISVSVTAFQDSSVPLAFAGATLLQLIITLFGNTMAERPSRVVLEDYSENGGSPMSDAVGDEKPMPLLLQYETQIFSALRKGAKSNSECASPVQQTALVILKDVIKKSICSSPSKAVELAVQAIVLIDPSSMPWSSYFALREAGNTVVSGRSAQTTEREVTITLYTRIGIIVDIISFAVRTDNQSILSELRKHSEYIHYYLLRLLIDCAVVCEHTHISPNLFSIMETDIAGLMEEIKTVLVPAVLNGLALSRKLEWGKIFCPMDCPFRTELSAEAMYVGVLRWIAAEYVHAGITCDQLNRLIVPIEYSLADVSDESIKTTLVAMLECVPVDEEHMVEYHYEMLRFAHEHHKQLKPEIVWNLTCIGMSPDGSDQESLHMVSDIVRWLMTQVNFFSSDRARIAHLVSECLFKLVKKQPQAIVKLMRESVAEIRDEKALCLLMDSVDNLFQTAHSDDVHFVVVLLIPVFARLMAIAPQDIHESLGKLRVSLAGCANVHAVVQCVSKLLIMSPNVPYDYVESFFLPISLALMRDCGRSACDSLLEPLVNICAPHKQESEWKNVVGYVMGLASVIDNEHVGKSLIVCMQTSIDVFKHCLGELSLEEKSKVELLARKYIPKREEGKNSDAEKFASAGQPSSTAPQIQLKLKFGKD